MATTLHIGTAGWAIPSRLHGAFPAAGSHLSRYGCVFSAVEINSTFKRVHRVATYSRWADSVPGTFHFSVKMPAQITHVHGLVNTRPAVDAFLHDVQNLDDKLGCILVQLPPALEFSRAVAATFFAHLRAAFAGDIAVEPRHSTWLTAHASELLRKHRCARVAADPARVAGADATGGIDTLAYFRLHGSPRIYYSRYSTEYIARLAVTLQTLEQRGTRTWCIFDNTTLGEATVNALELLDATR